MSHRVIQFNSVVENFTKADAIQDDIKNKLDSESYDLNSRQVNDGQNLDGEATLAIKTDHNNDTEANEFFDWIRNYVKSNSTDFKSARLRVHDCQNLEGLNTPCEIGNSWEL